ncbi:WecB/TagA/CpsF family glycosyltransferase [Clostridium rectalis]|uniref:WecB/TagA/CpsF family glycosyltransferase n=1 Tax=Clostridium rectalis TaxID=2040295 RepID=UPI000F638469|nr:WecB/TagA/CpsF family glycosyltransferase [Clostridium rectalis]
MFSKILNYNIFNGSKEELIKYINNMEKVHVISGNPEVLTSGLNNKQLYKNFISDKSVIIPDGVGTVIASKLVKEPVKEKIAGIEVMEELLKYCNENSLGVYFLGTREETLLKCIENIRERYPKILIKGYHNGFFNLDNCKNIVNEIKTVKPYILFAAMGCPRQEKFICKYMEDIPSKIFMGVGGSFDIFAGELKRAPNWMIKLGLEWLYRVYKEPYRIKRLTSIPKFLLKVNREK